MSYVVYALVDPRDNSIHYVGITDDVYTRFLQHINCSSGNFAKNAWIMELRAINRMVIMETLEEVESLDLAKERETYWIRHFEAIKEPIKNIHKRAFPKRAKKVLLRQSVPSYYTSLTVGEKPHAVQEKHREYYERALKAWNAGSQTVRALAQTIEVPDSFAYQLLKEMDKMGLIQMRRR